MEINCPSCSEAVLITDEDMAKTFECPFCQQPIEFESKEEETQPEENTLEMSPENTVFCEVCKKTSELVSDVGHDEYFPCPNPKCNATINFLGRDWGYGDTKGLAKAVDVVAPMLGEEEESTISEKHRRLLSSRLLVQCPACFEAVSKQADICPSCGHPIYRGVLGKAGASRIINVTFLVLLVVCVFFCLITNPFRW